LRPELRVALLSLALVAPIVDRRHLSQHCKDPGYKISPVLELSTRDGELQWLSSAMARPTSCCSSTGRD
jgi:hypothetical protein